MTALVVPVARRRRHAADTHPDGLSAPAIVSWYWARRRTMPRPAVPAGIAR